MIRLFVALLFCIASMTATTVAAPVRAGGGIIFVTGTHHEPNGEAKTSGVPAPLLFIEHDTGRFTLYAESIPPEGQVPVSGSGLGVSGVELTYLGISARYHPTATTSIGIGETIYNQQTVYSKNYEPPTNPGGTYLTSTAQTDRSRVVGVQYLVDQILHRSARSETQLSFAVNPGMRGNLGILSQSSLSNGQTFQGHWFSTPEKGTQIDSMLVESVTNAHFTLRYGIRYLNLTMKFPDGFLADRNTFVIPFIGVSIDLGKAHRS